MMSELNNGISRRSVLKGAAVGGLGLAAGGSLLAGCGSKDAGPMKWGGRGLEESSVQWHEAVKAAYEEKTGTTVTLNMNDSNAFQDNLSQYLQGTPDDGFDCMAGYSPFLGKKLHFVTILLPLLPIKYSGVSVDFQ
jgi:multiple sugar transport system substrate-binding protein